MTGMTGMTGMDGRNGTAPCTAPPGLRARQRRWLAERTTTGRPGDLARALDLLGPHRVAVVVPARDEAATVGTVVGALTAALTRVATGPGVEVVVVDDASTDGTAAVAAAAGARVVRCPHRLGKGGALRAGVAATTADLLVFLDADVPDLRADWVGSLLLPLLRDPGVVMVKAAYDRPLTSDGVVHPGSGGRVSRLVAVPALNLLAPELTVLAQPLAGETALRRDVLRPDSLADGYAVELGLLLDVHARVGLDGLAQVDLGERAHRHHSDDDLGRMATEVLRVALERSGAAVPGRGYVRAVRDGDGQWRLQGDDPADGG